MTGWVDRVLDVEVGAAAHGGSCVARADGRVVFVRHALPGERVKAVVTDDPGGSFCRADAIEVLRAAPDRVEAPCVHAGPGRCGGCDWQHASGPAQRALKAAIVREQFRRLAGLDVDIEAAQELPGGLLGWRTRVTYAVDEAGTVGLHRHRSRDLEPVATCPLGAPAVADAPDARPGVTGIELATDDFDELATLRHRPGPGRQARGRRPPDRVELIAGPRLLRHRVGTRTLQVSAEGFWQAHPHALAALGVALLEAVQPQPGEIALELYTGAGPLTSLLADAVGPTGQVLGIESSAGAVADAARNLADRPWARVERGRVDAALIDSLELRPDLVVLDPPRAGAGSATMAAMLRRQPTRIGYVSCDPATLARDVRVALDAGWRLHSLRVFDAFPMTHHIECVASLRPDTGEVGETDGYR